MEQKDKKNPRRLITQPFDFSVRDLVYKIDQKEIILNPEYQRNYRWDIGDDGDCDKEDYKKNKRSRLIESLLLNIPIPVLYFAETNIDQEYEVIDGQQRLRTLYDFLHDKFSLNNLSIRNDVNNKKYSELDDVDQGLINKRGIRSIVILNDSDADLKYEVFERLNLGSLQLTPQEIRNNTLRGSFNEFLKYLAKNLDYKSMLTFQLEKDTENMSYEEMILRFFAYYETNLEKKIGDTPYNELNIFLTAYMRFYQNINDAKKNEFEALFLGTLQKVKEFLGDNAFSVYSGKSNDWGKNSNRLMFEAEMLAFADILYRNQQEIKITPDEFKDTLKNALIDDKEFNKSITAASGGKLKTRVNVVKDILLGTYKANMD